MLAADFSLLESTDHELSCFPSPAGYELFLQAHSAVLEAHLVFTVLVTAEPIRESFVTPAFLQKSRGMDKSSPSGLLSR